MMGKNYFEITEQIENGRSFHMHKEVGGLRKNCVYAQSIEDIPQFLIEDGAIEIGTKVHYDAIVLPGNKEHTIDDDDIVLWAIEGPAVRKLPIYICWEEVSIANRCKVPGKYGSWPKDNGSSTIKVVGGKCYNLPNVVKASLIGAAVPDWVADAGFPISLTDDTATLIRTDWGGEVRSGRVGRALWVQYDEGDVNILDLSEESAKEYVICDQDGQDIVRLTDILAGLC